MITYLRFRKTIILAVFATLFLLWAVAVVFAQGTTYKPVQVVFAVDTSGSMEEEWATLCNNLQDIVSGLQNKGITVESEILAIDQPFEASGSNSCTGGKTVRDTVPNPTVNHYEDWGPAVVDLSNQYSWKNGYVRVIIAVSDEGPQDGDPVDDADRQSIQDAIAAAKNNNVIVSVILGTGTPTDVVPLANDLASATGGIVSRLDQANLVQQMVDAIARALQTAPVVDKVKTVIQTAGYEVDFVSQPQTIPTDTLKVEIPYEYKGPEGTTLKFVFGTQKESGGKLQSIQVLNAYVIGEGGDTHQANYDAANDVYVSEIQNAKPGSYTAVVEGTEPGDAGTEVVVGVGVSTPAPEPYAIPEPFTLGLLGAGLAALGAYARRQRQL